MVKHLSSEGAAQAAFGVGKIFLCRAFSAYDVIEFINPGLRPGLMNAGLSGL
jgi:hypothetical protein